MQDSSAKPTNIRKPDPDPSYQKSLLNGAHKTIEFISRELSKSETELTQLRTQIQALLNSLGQGFLVFDQKGICSPLYSEACLDLLETDPGSKPISEVLQIPPEKQAGFLGWIELIFSNVMDFDDLAPLGPKTFPSSLGRLIELEFKPVLDKQNQVINVVVLATDKTDQLQAEEEAQRRQNYAEMILRISRDRNEFLMFVRKVRELIEIFASYSSSNRKISLSEIRRLLHTVKGGAGSFYLMSMKGIVHQFETEISTFLEKNPPPPSEELGGRIEHYGVTLELELANVLTENRGLLGEDFEKQGYIRKIGYQDLLAFAKKLEQLPEGHAISLDFLKTLAGIPISQAFLQFNSIIQQTALNLGKKVKPIQFSGEDPRVLPELYEDFFAAVVHIFTNDVVHGIETPSERTAAGKSSMGSIRVSVSLKNSESEIPKETLHIVIEDDGRGINPEAIRQRLSRLNKGDSQDWANETDTEVIQHIFDEGFSTRESVNELSGRGVGLTALKEVISKLGGSILVQSALGKKTEFVINLPYLWCGPSL